MNLLISPAAGFSAGASLPSMLAAGQNQALDQAMIGVADSAGHAQFESMLQRWFVARRNAQMGWLQAFGQVS